MKDTIVTLKEKRSHSFLLDKTGLPVFVGNPTHGKDIRVFSYDDDVQECDRPERKKNYHRLWYYSYLLTTLNFSIMKKLIILASTIVLTASAATAAYVCSQKSSDLFEANVAALTKGEYDYKDGFPYSFQCNVSLGGLKRCKVTVITCQGGGSGCNERKCPMHG